MRTSEHLAASSVEPDSTIVHLLPVVVLGCIPCDSVSTCRLYSSIVLPEFVWIVSLRLSEFSRIVKGAAVRASIGNSSGGIGWVSILNVRLINPPVSWHWEIFDILEIHRIEDIELILQLKATRYFCCYCWRTSHPSPRLSNSHIWILEIVIGLKIELAGHGCALELTWAVDQIVEESLITTSDHAHGDWEADNLGLVHLILILAVGFEVLGPEAEFTEEVLHFQLLWMF